MCNYQYKNFSINKKNYSCQLSTHFDELPVDSEGKCVFHSQNISWKEKNDFVDFLTKYVSKCRKNNYEIDLREVHFIAKKDRIIIDYIDIISGANLVGVTFHDSIELKGKNLKKKIPNELSFKDCTFKNNVKFKNCEFREKLEFCEVTFENVYGVLYLEFHDCSFYYFDFIRNKNFGAHIAIVGCEFMEDVSFENFTMSDNFLDIVDNTFNERFAFRNSEVDTLYINLSNNEFNEEATFENTSFYATTDFNTPKVVQKLIFTGSAERKIFYGQTRFSLKDEDVQGQIIFQQTQLNVVKKEDLEKIKELTKIGESDRKKVVIGSGCIKYRWQTDPKTIRIDAENNYIIQEFANSFAVFLSKWENVNFGIELLEKTSTELTFFYFSDQDLGNEFYETFYHAQEMYLGLLANSLPTPEVDMQKEEIINFLRTRLSQNSILIQARLQHENQKWNESDTQALIESLTLPNQKVLPLDELHHSIISMSMQKLIEFAKQPSTPIQIFLINSNVAHKITKIDNVHGNVNNHSSQEE